MLPLVSPPPRLYPRDGLENLLAPAISYSFDQFWMRVQYLLSIALFLDGHHSAIESSHLVMPHAFKVWPDLSGRGLGLQWIQTWCFCFMQLTIFCFSFAAMPAWHRSIPKKYWTCAVDGVTLSHTTPGIRACFPFGASHRVNIDTPPLQGNCPDTLVSR
jgi:hypothetical protein